MGKYKFCTPEFWLFLPFSLDKLGLWTHWYTLDGMPDHLRASHTHISCFWEMGRSQRTWKNSIQTWGEHANLHTDNNPNSGLNQEPSSWGSNTTCWVFINLKLNSVSHTASSMNFGTLAKDSSVLEDLDSFCIEEQSDCLVCMLQSHQALQEQLKAVVQAKGGYKTR